jgi:hypothetical protein
VQSSCGLQRMPTLEIALECLLPLTAIEVWSIKAERPLIRFVLRRARRVRERFVAFPYIFRISPKALRSLYVCA